MMIVGFIIYVLLLPTLFTDMGVSESIMKEEPGMIMILLGNIAGALLLAHVYNHWAKIATFMTGAKAGAIFGLLISLYSGLIQYGTTTISSSITPYLVDALIGALLWAIAGGVVGLVLGKTSGGS